MRNKILSALAVLALVIAPLALIGAISGQLCIPGLACITGNGTYIYIDTDRDGTLDSTEPNLTINAPLGTTGNETIQGDLVVTGDFSVNGITYTNEQTILWWNGVYNAAPAADQELRPHVYGQALTSATSAEMSLPLKMHLTRFCAANYGTVTIGASALATYGVYDVTAAAYITGAEITWADSGGNITGADRAVYCGTINATYTAGNRITLKVKTATNTPHVPGITFTLLGYGID